MHILLNDNPVLSYYEQNLYYPKSRSDFLAAPFNKFDAEHRKKIEEALGEITF